VLCLTPWLWPSLRGPNTKDKNGSDCVLGRELSLNILFLQVRWESKTSDSQDTKKSRWKFLFGGTLVALLLQLNNLAQGKIPSNAEGYGSVIGSAIAGFLVG
jgi:hypothetical protein